MTSIQSTQGTLIDLSQVRSMIPQTWYQEVRRFMDQKLLMRDYTTVQSFQGSKVGDTIRFPNIGRVPIQAKLPQTPLSLSPRPDSDYTITITRPMAVAEGIEDIVNFQSAYDVRSPLMQEMSYTMARDIDNFILSHRAVINSYPTQRIYSFNDGVNNLIGDGTVNAHLTGTPAPLTLAALLAAKQKLEEADVDETDMILFVSPAQYNDLYSILQFTSRDFVGNSPFDSGKFTSLWGMLRVMRTTQIGPNGLTNLNRVGEGLIAAPSPGVLNSPYYPDQVVNPNIVSTGSASDLAVVQNAFGLPVRSGAGATAADGGQTLGVVGGANQWATALLCTKQWARLALQLDTTIETSRDHLRFADIITMTNIYGCKVWRPDQAIVIHTSAV